jgi:hypothetical protein
MERFYDCQKKMVITITIRLLQWKLVLGNIILRNWSTMSFLNDKNLGGTNYMDMETNSSHFSTTKGQSVASF